MSPFRTAALSALITAITLSTSQAQAQDSRFVLELELGSTWQSSNDVQIPNDDLGTRFALDDLTGDGPWASVRINATWNINERHAVRAVLAPLGLEETGRSDKPIEFAGGSFVANEDIEAKYTFNSWRLGYRYQYYDEGPWDLWVGATAKIRDAEIRLQQGAVTASDSDVGFVPLLHLAGRYQINQQWYLAADFDGLAGGPGRAFDIGVKLGYQLGDALDVQLGYRTLEGGADTDDVYNFAWFNSAILGVQYRF